MKDFFDSSSVQNKMFHLDYIHIKLTDNTYIKSYFYL